MIDELKYFGFCYVMGVSTVKLGIFKEKLRKRILVARKFCLNPYRVDLEPCVAAWPPTALTGTPAGGTSLPNTF
jgi:hypothetical protein